MRSVLGAMLGTPYLLRWDRGPGTISCVAASKQASADSDGSIRQVGATSKGKVGGPRQEHLAASLSRLAAEFIKQHTRADTARGACGSPLASGRRTACRGELHGA